MRNFMLIVLMYVYYRVLFKDNAPPRNENNITQLTSHFEAFIISGGYDAILWFSKTV